MSLDAANITGWSWRPGMLRLGLFIAAFAGFAAALDTVV